jgi:hypothetical protein
MLDGEVPHVTRQFHRRRHRHIHPKPDDPKTRSKKAVTMPYLTQDFINECLTMATVDEEDAKRVGWLCQIATKANEFAAEAMCRCGYERTPCFACSIANILDARPN